MMNIRLLKESFITFFQPVKGSFKGYTSSLVDLNGNASDSANSFVFVLRSPVPSLYGIHCLSQALIDIIIMILTKYFVCLLSASDSVQRRWS